LKTYTLSEVCKLTGLKKFDLSIMTYTKKFIPYKVCGGSGNRNEYSEDDVKLLKEFATKKKELYQIKKKLKLISIERSYQELV
jgi:hypothetical protein